MFKRQEPRWDGTYTYITEEYGGHPEPALDEEWPDLDKLRWHLAGALYGTDIKIEVMEGQVERAGRRVPGMYAFNYADGCSCCNDFWGAWDKINGIELGLRLAGLKTR